MIEPTIDGKDDAAYREAVRLLRKVRGLMARLGREDEFGRYLESVRGAHFRKRRFVRLIERVRWA